MTRTPVVLIHGAWLHMSCWEGWADRFTAHGYAVAVPGWPGEAGDAAVVRRDPGPLRDLGLDELTAHYTRAVRALDRPPVVVGHGVGGLIAQHLLSLGLAEAAVALAPMPPPGVPGAELRPTLASQVWGGPGGHEGAVPLPRAEFRHALANAVGEQEAARLYDRYAIPAPSRMLADLRGGADAGTGVDVANADRGSLLLISGQEDRIVPDVTTRAVYKLYGDTAAVTDLKQFADRGHSLVVDSGWRQVADYVLGWLVSQGIRGAAPTLSRA